MKTVKLVKGAQVHVLPYSPGDEAAAVDADPYGLPGVNEGQ